MHLIASYYDPYAPGATCNGRPCGSVGSCGKKLPRGGEWAAWPASAGGDKMCNRTITVQAGSKRISVPVLDVNAGDRLDLSIDAFRKLAPTSQGIVSVQVSGPGISKKASTPPGGARGSDPGKGDKYLCIPPPYPATACTLDKDTLAQVSDEATGWGGLVDKGIGVPVMRSLYLNVISKAIADACGDDPANHASEAAAWLDWGEKAYPCIEKLGQIAMDTVGKKLKETLSKCPGFIPQPLCDFLAALGSAGLWIRVILVVAGVALLILLAYQVMKG